MWWERQLGTIQGCVLGARGVSQEPPGLWRVAGNTPLGLATLAGGLRVPKLPSAPIPGDTAVRKKPAALSVPLRRKEEFSLFKVSDNEYKVKISPQLLLATQRFLSRGEDEGWFLSPLSRLPVQGVRRPGAAPASPSQ